MIINLEQAIAQNSNPGELRVLANCVERHTKREHHPKSPMFAEGFAHARALRRLASDLLKR